MIQWPHIAAVGCVICLGWGMLLLGASAAASPPGVVERPSVDQLPVIEELPDPFLMADGSRVKTREDWARRREELKALILYYEFGHMPPAPGNVTGKETSSKANADLGATEKQVLLTFGPDKKIELHLDLTIPAGKSGPLPAVIKGDLCWKKIPQEILKMAVSRGYIVAEFDRTELAPDKADRTTPAFPAYPDYDWSTEAAWAWGFHRVVDYLVTLDYVDAKHIAVTGHSRGGKAALLAGATDERIALTVPNGSGAGGSGLYRLMLPTAESLTQISTRFPFWFVPRFKEFQGKETRLPFDHHELRALCAPRAHLSTDALGDLWANPQGTQQAYLAAREVYAFLGAADKIGQHFREGKHAHNEEDWAALLDFADRQFFGKTVTRTFEGQAFPDMPKMFSWSAPKAAK